MTQKIKGTIDPGHGGNDRANVGPTGYVEADGVLDISKILKAKLEATGKFDIKLTRDTDKTLGLSERARIAANFGSKFFISQHTNAASATSKGAEVFYSVKRPNDRKYAEKMSANIANALGIYNRGPKVRESENYPGQDYYTVINVSERYGIPHIFLVESAFHSNPNEEKLLKDPKMREAIADAQAKVICEIFGVEYNSNQPIKPAEQIKPVEPTTESKVDNTNNETLQVQKLLNSLKITDYEGKKLVEDGYWGPRTESAVKKFQKYVLIPVTGTIDTTTKNTLIAVSDRYEKATKSNETLQIQKWMNQLKITDYEGKKLVEDGYWGLRTESAVRKFQKAQCLAVDGIVGTNTKNAINAKLNLVKAPGTKPTENKSTTTKSNETLQIQKWMNQLKITDYEGKKLVEDGYWGLRTESAVKKFQQIVGLTVDGIVGTNTKSAINTILAKTTTRRGDKGLIVRYIQHRVGSSVDGIFGPNTEAAVKIFQSKNGLSVDGIVGPKTWSKLI